MLTGTDISDFLSTGAPPAIADRAEIGDVIAAYAACCDFAAIDTLISLFTVDAVWDGREFRFPRCEGHAELRSHFESVCRPGMRQVHNMGQVMLRAESEDVVHG